MRPDSLYAPKRSTAPCPRPLAMSPCDMAHPISSWADVAPRLIAVAAGREAADLVVRNARVVSVHTREVLPGWSVEVSEGRFAYVGPDAARTRYLSALAGEFDPVQGDMVSMWAA